MLENKIILLGFGFLGEEICNEAIKRNCGVKKTRLHKSDGVIQLDINDHGKVKNLIESQKPGIVINCISRNDIDNMEIDPKLATDVNFRGPQIIAEASDKMGSRLIHISTDQVYNGSSKKPSREININLTNHYSISKYKGEKALKNLSLIHI